MTMLKETDAGLLLERVHSLQRLHGLGLLGGEEMPEDAVSVAKKDQHWLDLLTLGMTLNYQRNSYALWRAVASAYNASDDRWVFSPKEVAASSSSDLRQVLVGHRIALQPNRHPEIWQRNATSIAALSPDASVAGLLRSLNYDVGRTSDFLRVQNKKGFPYLSGPKIFNYWLYVLETHGQVKWRSRERITIAPDTHILQASVRLGLVPAGVLAGTAQDRDNVAAAWDELLRGTGLEPIDVHTPLWLWSKLGLPCIEDLARETAEL